MSAAGDVQRQTFDDPLRLLPRLVTWLHSRWLSVTYPFASVARGLSIHYTCELHRSKAHLIKLGRSVLLGKDTWLNVQRSDDSAGEPAIVIEDGCLIGRRSTLSAKNSILLERDVMLGPSVLIMDHNHAYENVFLPIKSQGVTDGGTIRIGAGSWIGHCASILCGKGDLVLGHNCIVAANAVVTHSYPPYSVISGNPARVVKQFDPARGCWVLGSVASASAAETQNIEVAAGRP